MQSVILAGGQGTRMRSISDIPKVLLPLNGKPIIARQLDWLSKSGFTETFLCLGYRAHEVMAALGNGSSCGIKIDYRVEDAPRGTAGAVRDLGDAIHDDLLVVYGDLYVDMDCEKLLRFHASHDGVATLVVRRTDHPEDSDIAEVDEHGWIQAVGRLADGQVSGNLGCAAIWVIRKEIIQFIPATGICDFARDVFPVAARSGARMMAYETTESIMDVGTPQRYNRFVSAKRAP